MEPVDKKMAALILGIEADVRAEEEKIIDDAERRAAEKRKYAQQKAESLVKEAKEKAEAQAASITQKATTAVEREVSRRSLRSRETLMQRIVDRTEKRLEAMIDDPAYRDVLVGWIAEAAVGLDADSAQVNASACERALIDAALLAEARGRAAARMGTPPVLTLADAPPLESQGVVLTTADGRIAFNNQVRTRMSRKRRDIQKLIYDAALVGSEKE
jgi:vacuolar-type H+-ATPase subunit E/Vma4